MCEIDPVQIWSLEMAHQPSSGPRPQYWIIVLDPLGAQVLSVLGLGSDLGRALCNEQGSAGWVTSELQYTIHLVA